MGTPYFFDGRLPGLLPVAALAAALAGCAQAPRPATGAQPAAAAAAPAGALARALDQAVARGAWSDLRLDTECWTDAGFRSATVFGSGAGVWNRERQFSLSRQDVLSLLRDLQAAGFAGWREVYGDGTQEEEAALELVCRVRLELEGAGKQVSQLSRGRRFPELMRLAGRILAAAEEAGRTGAGASSLTEGLGKIARGELAPELLSLQIVRRSEAPGPEAGWDLSLEGGKVSLQRHPVPEGEEPAAFRLQPAQVAELAGQLAAARLEELPPSLWASEYTDLRVAVLNHRRSLQARQFAEMTPATHGERQQRFDRLWEALSALHRRLAAGRPEQELPADARTGML